MFLTGADDGSRTHTGVSPADFESAVSAIPPHRQEHIYNNINLSFMQEIN